MTGASSPSFIYRFDDQPPLLTADERDAKQKKVEMPHEAWTNDKQYLPPPSVGTLADPDPAVFLTLRRGWKSGTCGSSTARR